MEKNNEAKRIRINTFSEKVASFTKNFLEEKLKHKFSYSISTKNYVMLDFDCERGGLFYPECFLEAEAIAKALVKEYGNTACIYRTPHGYHLIHYRHLPWKTVKKILASLLDAKKRGELEWIDEAHLEASLRRGYITLRLNQEYRAICVRLTYDGEVEEY